VARHPRAQGETDSESVFNVLLDNVGRHRRLDNGTSFNGIAMGVVSLFEDYEFGRRIGLNFVMSDGRAIYTFNHHAEKPMFFSFDSEGITVSTRKP